MKKLVAVCTALVFSVSMAAPANAVIKAGDKCTKAGRTSTYAGKKFTCAKSGNRLIWSKGVAIAKPAIVQPQPAPAPSTGASPASPELPKAEVKKVDYSQIFSTDQGYYTDFAGPCDYDRAIEGDLVAIQDYFFQFTRCGGQLRVNKYSLGSARPTANYSAASEFSNTEPCKLVTPANVRSSLGFTTAEPGRNQYEALRKFPSPNAVVQLIPIYAADSAQPQNSPAEDYGPYLKLVKDWLEYSTDYSSNAEIRIPSQYIKLNSNLADYNVSHENRHDSPSHVAFNKDVVSAVDPVIDFSRVNIAIIVPPAKTNSKVFAQASIGSLQTNEGFVALGMTEAGHLAAEPSNGNFSNLGHPFWWIHELLHSGVGYDDHYGDMRQDINTEYGMGWLTMMTPFGGDLTTWEKWRLGFMKDSQVQCVSTTGSSTHWIAPSTVQTSESKAIVVRVSATKVVIVETLRPAGLYYKIPKQTQGALVYEVDLMETRHGLGMKLSLPIGRKVESNPFFMASYPLKQGESTISNGYKFTIVESGTYGDVVKVEKQ